MAGKRCTFWLPDEARDRLRKLALIFGKSQAGMIAHMAEHYHAPYEMSGKPNDSLKQEQNDLSHKSNNEKLAEKEAI